jgi:hypothetical protein
MAKFFFFSFWFFGGDEPITKAHFFKKIKIKINSALGAPPTN